MKTYRILAHYRQDVYLDVVAESALEASEIAAEYSIEDFIPTYDRPHELEWDEVDFMGSIEHEDNDFYAPDQMEQTK